MGNIWIVDLRDYLNPDGTIVDFAGRAQAEYFANIVVHTTANMDDRAGVRCRRRPRHQRCAGRVVSDISTDKDEPIHWFCPVCGDNGSISGWQNTRWDRIAATTAPPSAVWKRP